MTSDAAPNRSANLQDEEAVVAQQGDAALTDFLLSQLTPRRRQRFEDVLRFRTRHATVLLENLSHSHNFSAVLRSCDCFGVQDAFMVDPRGTFSVSKDVALGAEKWLTIRRFEGDSPTSEAISGLKARGYRLIVTSPHGDATPLHQFDVSYPFALAFGTELTGVSDEIEAAADERIAIPMVGFTESFNVSVAAALCLADVTQRIRDGVENWWIGEAAAAELRLEWARRSITSVSVLEQRFTERTL